MIKPNPQFKKQTVLLDDNRSSFNNRRISLEKIKLPDGRICTRVPARKRGKVGNLFDLSIVLILKNKNRSLTCQLTSRLISLSLFSLMRRLNFQRYPDWHLFQFECEFCPHFQDLRKYKRKSELLRHQALHFPDRAKKFNCTMCSYTATR